MPTIELRGICVCVGYDDLLAITLPANMRHLRECLIVTSPDDKATQQLTAKTPGVRVFTTDAFTRHGAIFNKGLAIEEGFDALGRHGWILAWDADVLLPDAMPLDRVKFGCLHGSKRRIVTVPRRWRRNHNWDRYKLGRDKEVAGYFQLFHADDPTLSNRPWHEVTFTHAGGGDGYFQSRWPDERKVWLDFDVLHFGPRDANWFGRVTERIDGRDIPGARRAKALMCRFLRWKGWGKRRTVARFDERVDVPGAPDTGYQLRAAKDRRR